MTESDSLSVVIPVSRDSATFRECLDAIRQSDRPPEEIVVVDDSGRDPGIGELSPPVRIIKSRGRAGPAHARNIGAAAATGSILVFIDSDVVVGKDTISSLEGLMRARGVGGAVALLSPRMRYRDFFSTYKNMFLHYSFTRVGDSVPSFYTCCALVRKALFVAAGGFDEKYMGPAIEDADFGHKLAAAGARVVADRGCLVEHAKRYTMGELLVLDFGRAAGLIRLFLRRRCRVLGRHETSVPAGFIASAPLSLVGIASLALFATRPFVFPAALFLACCAGGGILNAGFIRAVRRHRGVVRAVQTAIFIPLDHLASIAGSLWGAVTYIAGRKY